jgi:uncharacterized membrane protein YraQ (UPF0718 family)
MAAGSDAENQTNIDEQTPLLDDHQSDQQPDQPVENSKGGSEKNASWYIWRIFWAIVAALVLAVFIKGWIDAGGDVDVGDQLMSRHYRTSSLTLCSSST